MEQQQQLSVKVPKLSESEKERDCLIKLLEERLEKHDNNRKVIQDKLKTTLNKLTGQIDELEERINKKLEEKFTSEDGRLQAALNELHENMTTNALQKTKIELLVFQSYEIIENNFDPRHDFTTLYELKTKRRTIPEDGYDGFASSEVSSSPYNRCNTTKKKEITCDSDKLVEERERLIELLGERLEKHDESRKAVQDKLHEICEGLRTQVVELEDRVSKELEEKFTSEDGRLQAALNELRGNSTAGALQKAKAELLVFQSYELIENKGREFDLITMYKLKAERRIVPELMEVRKPTNVRVAGVNRGRVSVQFTCFNPDEERVLLDNGIVNPVKYRCLFFKKGNEQESKEYPLEKNDDNDSFTFTPDTLVAGTPYGIRAKIIIGDRESEWSDEVAEFTPEFRKCCVWKKCLDDVNKWRKYSVDGRNLRVATKVNDRLNGHDYCTIIGSTSVPPKAVTSWSVKVLESMYNNGGHIYIGIAQNDVNQNDYDNYDNYYKCGWYFDCYSSTLRSGPPHNYGWPDKEYGPRKGKGQYVHTGDSVGVAMDTTKGDLSFVLNNVNLGVAYEGIPLDKPLVPCVIINTRGDSVELDTSEVKETEVDSSVPVPSNIITEGTTWDSITLTWDEVVDASFYQVEMDGSKSWELATTNTFTKRGFLPESEHSFRMRAVKGSSVSEWSGVAKGRTLKAPKFSECVWEECPDHVKDDRKYIVDEGNPRIATRVNGNSNKDCTIIGCTSVPLNKVTSWSVKVLKSRDNDGDGIFVGVAPSDINQNDDNYGKCGWYFNCCCSWLMSGPPHYYNFKEYGPRNKCGRYVYTGDSVGVVMDTTKGELSFVLNNVNYGVAFERIPLDKPLVPCVILWYKDDSVELGFALNEVKENVDSSIPVLSNITVKSTTWDSITLAWGKVVDASFYQIEVNGSISRGVVAANVFTKKGLLPETEHNFRVRVVRKSLVSEWSGVVKGRTLEAPEFSECVWKKCPDGVVDDRKYSVNWVNPRVATNINGNGWCTIIGNTPIPLNTVTSWNVKIHKSRDNDGGGIYIGIAPSDINQNDVNNYNKCGWYLYCYLSTLRSGPPHYYHKEYGPRKWGGGYVHTGDSVGVVMDTTRGDLSFALNGTNRGVAYCGIPLDKPLVPCVLLRYKDDSVELGFALNEGNHGVAYEEITTRIKWICKQFHSILFFVTFLVVVIAAVISYDGGTHAV